MSNRGALALLSLATPLAWVGLIYMVIGLSPESVATRVVFFILVYFAMLGTFGLAAYFASFRLFPVKIHRGNATNALHQGVLVASFLLVALLLQAARALSTMAVLVLMATFAIAGFVTLRKQYH